MRPIKITLAIKICLWISLNSFAQSHKLLIETFEDPAPTLEIIGRGSCIVEDGRLRSKDAYAAFGSRMCTMQIILNLILLIMPWKELCSRY
jgi:hypothetical protein